MTDDEILQRLELILEKEEQDAMLLEQELFEQELKWEEQQQRQQQQQQQTSPDWLQTRRSKLGQYDDVDDDDNNEKDGKNNNTVIPINKHTLLTIEEYKTILKAYGGTDIVVIPDDMEQPRMGGSADGMIVCTASGTAGNDNDVEESSTINLYHQHRQLSSTSSSSLLLVNIIAKRLIDHLKQRQLQDIGVLAAKTNTTRTRNGSKNNDLFQNSNWQVVDCGNYIVHIMDATTRKALQLEKLWSGNDPLWKLQYWNDDDIEDYCAKYPVPKQYNGNDINTTTSNNSIWDPTTIIRQLERSNNNQYNTRILRHRPVVANAIKRNDRKQGRKKRREQKQYQQYQQQHGQGR